MGIGAPMVPGEARGAPVGGVATCIGDGTGGAPLEGVAGLEGTVVVPGVGAAPVGVPGTPPSPAAPGVPASFFVIFTAI